MKRLIAAILVLITLTALLCACGKDKTPDTPDDGVIDNSGINDPDDKEQNNDKEQTGDTEPDPRWADEVMNPEMEVVLAVAEAYMDRKQYIQYDEFGMNRVSKSAARYEFTLPEAANYQHYVHMECGVFVRNVLLYIYGYKIPSATVVLDPAYANTNGERVFYFKGEENQTPEDEEKAMQELLDTLQPGDVLYYNFVTNNHVMLYVGNGMFWHCSSNGVPANYDYEMKEDRTEGRGALYESSFDEYFAAHDIFDSVNKVCLYRPFNMGYDMSEQAVLRTEKLQDLVIYKTTSAPEGVSVNPGGEVEIQIMIRSARDEDATVNITDVIPEGMEYVSGADSVENGVMNWTVTIPARETATIKYVCRVKNDASLVGKLIAWDQTKVEGVIINDTPVYVGVTLTEQEQKALMEINYKDLTAKNDIELITEVYGKIGLTTNAQTAADYLSDLFPSYPGFSVMSEVTPVRDENTSTGISFVPNLYGGQNCNTMTVETGIRVRRMEEMYLIPGDIIVNSTTYSAENAELYIYLGDEVFVSASSGKIRKANADSLLDSMLGQFCFAVLRPSMCYPVHDNGTVLPEEYTGTDAVTVTFDLGGGLENITLKLKKGTALDKYVPMRTGHNFAGWQMEGADVAFPYTVFGDTTLTAKWSTPELLTPAITAQPADTSVALFERKGPAIKVEAMQGYSLRYQWYKTDKAASEGGTAIAGATSATGVVDTSNAKAGDTFYVYCVVTAVRNSDGKQTSVTSAPAKITIKAGDPNILFIGSGVLKRGGLNDMGEYLGAFYKAAGQNVNIDYITKGSDYNIYETGLTGTEQSLVREKLEAKTYTAVIIQIGRDYALYTGSTKNKELTAYKTIATMVEELSPGCQILLTFGPWRQDTTTNWFPRYEEQGIIGIEGHKEAILKYYEGTYAPLGGFKLIDTVTAFEKAVEAGINPFGGTTDDYPGVEGSYLMAAMAYGHLTGKTPVGLNVFSSYPGVVSKENAEKLQQIASEMVGIDYTPTALDPSKEIGGSSIRPVDDGTFNVLIIGSGVTKQSGKHDSVQFLRDLLSDAGKNINVDEITYGNDYNLWEAGLTGADQSKVKDLMQKKVYKYVVIQISRDYALYTGSTRNSEIAAYKNILLMISKLSPDCKVVLTFGPWRQDTTTTWLGKLADAGISGIEGQKDAIAKYYSDYYATLGEHSLNDLVKAFEMALEADVNPYRETSDYPGLAGSYMLACMNYAQITGESPVGLAPGSISLGDVTAYEAAVAQAIAAHLVLGTEYVKPNKADYPDTPIIPDVPADDGKLNILVIGSGVLKWEGYHDSIEFLQNMLKDAGADAHIDAVTLGSNYAVYESALIGADYANVHNLTKTTAYDYVIIQANRDYALYTGSTRTKEIDTVKSIMEMVRKTSPDAQLISVIGPWRRNTGDSWLPKLESAGIVGEQAHKDAIRKYYNDYLKPAAGGKVNDAITAFEKALDAGINPFASKISDMPGINGSYLIAAVNYMLITGNSPVGLPTVSSTLGSVSAADAATLQQLAADTVNGVQSEVGGSDTPDTPVTPPASDDALNVLVIGSGIVKRPEGEKQDSIDFLTKMLSETEAGSSVDAILKGNDYNVWETGLTGDGQSKVIDLLKTKSFDAIIIQVSRDYAIFTGSTASKEVAAVQNIADAAEQYAPGAKLIFMVGIDRDYATTGWNSKYSNAGISSQTALRSKMMNYYETKIAAAADGVCCDLITAFSEAEKAGIKVREAATPDYPNVQGGYLIACMNYAHITGKSPVGLTTVTSASGSVTAAEAATLQAIAAEIVIGK